jgi:hypothetical protein
MLLVSFIISLQVMASIPGSSKGTRLACTVHSLQFRSLTSDDGSGIGLDPFYSLVRTDQVLQSLLGYIVSGFLDLGRDSISQHTKDSLGPCLDSVI